jgi:hypothetical protein
MLYVIVGIIFIIWVSASTAWLMGNFVEEYQENFDDLDE